MYHRFVVPVLGILVLLPWCHSQTLSRPKAAAAIQQAYFSNAAIKQSANAVMFTVGSSQVVGENGGAMPGFIGLPDLKNFAALGWINLAINYCQFNTCGVNVSLTPKGESVSSGWILVSQNIWKVPIGQKEFIEVTGITKASPSVAVVEYNFRWVPTIYGKELNLKPTDPQKDSVTFQLYDDGWRIAR